jgi:type IV secretion system protein VirD4
MLDEFAKLGHMEPVADAVSLMAGYGVTLWLFLQDLPQLKGNYDDSWQTFMGNVDVLQSFGTKDQFTGEYVSKAAGEQTVFQKSTTQRQERIQSPARGGVLRVRDRATARHTR